MPLFQPFDPEDRPGRKTLKQLQQVPVRLVLPNLVTLLALCAGLSAIRMAVENRFELAIIFIAIAAALDAVDGRMARFLKSTSRFGAELDSITDFLNFGVAPVILIYVWTLSEMGSVGWIAVLIFAICVSLRLARFNAAIGAKDRPDWHGMFFVGVPAPAGAMVVMLPLYVELVALPHGWLTAPIVWVYTICIGLLMLSRVPTWSAKLVGNRMPRDLVLPLLVAGVVVVASLVSFTWLTMLVLSLAYLGSLPVSWKSYQRRDREEAATGAAGGSSPDDGVDSADGGDGGEK